MTRKELIQWEAELPKEMKFTTSLDDPPGFWASMLHLAYKSAYSPIYFSEQR